MHSAIREKNLECSLPTSFINNFCISDNFRDRSKVTNSVSRIVNISNIEKITENNDVKKNQRSLERIGSIFLFNLYLRRFIKNVFCNMSAVFARVFAKPNLP